MSDNIVALPLYYYGAPNKKGPLFNAKIYVGTPDLDPRILANRKDIIFRNEDGTTVPISPSQQPVRTSSGGYATYNGQIGQVLVDGNYSIAVDSSQDVQQYYWPNYFNGTPLVIGDEGEIDHGLLKNKDAPQKAHDQIYRRKTTATETSSGVFSPGDNLSLSERGDAPFNVVTGGTPNGFDILDAGNGNTAVLTWSGVVLTKWFGVIGDGLVDDTLPLQAFIDYCRDNDVSGTSDTSDLGYLITDTLKTQKDPTFKRLNIDFLDTKITADFSGKPALLIEGGPNFQNIKGLNLTTSEDNKYTGTFNSLSTGIRILNARHNLVARVYGFKGEGALIESTSGQTNGSFHNIDSQVNGRGVLVTGSADDISVVRSIIRTASNGREGVRIADTSAMRQWIGVWNCEANWTEDPIQTNYGVYIGKCIDSDLWIYSEQSGATGEVFLNTATCLNNRVFSARRNKDVIGGTNQAWSGRDVYQNETGVRPSEPLRVVGKLARTTVSGEYVRVPFVGFNESIMGYVYAERDRIGSLSSDSLIFSGVDTRSAIVNKKEVYGYDASLSTSTPSQTFIIGTLTAGTMISGNVQFSGRANSSGAGYFIYKADFFCNGLSVTTNTPLINEAAGPSPATVVLSVDGSNRLVATVTYLPAQWGASYGGKLSLEAVTFGSFL